MHEKMHEKIKEEKNCLKPRKHRIFALFLVTYFGAFGDVLRHYSNSYMSLEEQYSDILLTLIVPNGQLEMDFTSQM